MRSQNVLGRTCNIHDRNTTPSVAAKSTHALILLIGDLHDLTAPRPGQGAAAVAWTSYAILRHSGRRNCSTHPPKGAYTTIENKIARDTGIREDCLYIIQAQPACRTSLIASGDSGGTYITYITCGGASVLPASTGCVVPHRPQHLFSRHPSLPFTFADLVGCRHSNERTVNVLHHRNEHERTLETAHPRGRLREHKEYKGLLQRDRRPSWCRKTWSRAHSDRHAVIRVPLSQIDVSTRES
jgi:hypothetical protein